MKKITYLFTLLLALLFSQGAWAEDKSVTITSSSALWSANGTFSNTSGDNAGSWRSTNGIISVLCLDGQAKILNYETKSRLANSNSFLIVANGDNHITGFSIKFKAYNEDGTARNSYITFHDGVQVNSNSSAEVTKSFSGLNAQVIKFTTGNNWVDIIDFSVSYAEGSDNTLCSTTPINTYNNHASAGWLKVLTPSDYVFYTMSSLRMNLRTDINSFDVYLVVSDHLVGSGTTSGLSESDFTAISSNSSGTSSTDVTFNFTNPVTLRGGSYYYLYFATKSNDTYTLSLRGVKVQLNSNSLGVGANVTDTGIYGSSNTWSIPFTATLTPVTSNLKCRLKAKWPNTSTSNQHYTNYVFAKTDNLNKLYKNNKTELSAADMINAKMVWNVTYSGSGLKLQNVGTERYISKFSSDKANGPDINLLTAENSTTAETLKIQEYNTQGKGYVALVSTNQLSVNNKISFLESFSSGNDYVGCHNNYDAGDAFIFERVKTVTFVDGEGEAFNVAANGGDAVSVIYVACDGSDASTLSLPSDKLYSLDSGETWLSNTDAAEAISAAGTSNISVIVAPAVSVTYNLIWDDPSTPIQTEASVNAPQGFSPSVTVPWNAPAFCDFSYDVSTIEESTTEVNVTINWDGPFEFSTDFNTATKWYYMTIGGQYAVSNSTTNCPTYTTKQIKETGLWAFVGNPIDGFNIINYASGADYKLRVDGTCAMSNVNQYNICYAEKYNEKLYIYNDPNEPFYLLRSGSQIGGGDFYETEGAITLEAVDWAGLTKAVIDDYASSHAPGEIFGTSEELVTTTKNTIDEYSAVFSKYLYESITSDFSGLIKYPEEGKFYIVKNVGTNKYLRVGNENKVGLGQAGLYDVLTSSTLDASCVVYISKSNDKFYFNGQGKQYSWASASPNYTTGNARAEAAPGKYVHYNITTSGQAGLAFVLGNGEGDYSSYTANSYYRDNGSGVIVGGTYDNDNAQWTMEEAEGLDLTLTLNNGGDSYYYATLCLPFDVTLNASAAYTLTMNSSKTGLTLSEAMSEISAGTPVFIRHNEETLTATIGTGYATTPSTSTSLTGCYVSTAVDANTVYTLGKEDGHIGFYKYTGTSIAANRAYVSHEVGESARGFVLDFGELTGISNVESQKESNVIYDMQGRRVQKAGKGLYIVNGKKVLY